MRINWDTPVDMLMHSDDIRYIELDEGELMHWKYIKKEKRPNGKWRYYYDWKDALGFDEYERYKQAKENMDAADAEYREEQNSKRKDRYSDDAGEQQDWTSKWNKEKTDTKKSLDEQAANKKRTEAGQAYVQAKKEFMETPVGKLYQLGQTIKKAANKVAKWFKGLFG